MMDTNPATQAGDPTSVYSGTRSFKAPLAAPEHPPYPNRDTEPPGLYKSPNLRGDPLDRDSWPKRFHDIDSLHYCLYHEPPHLKDHHFSPKDAKILSPAPPWRRIALHGLAGARSLPSRWWRKHKSFI